PQGSLIGMFANIDHRICKAAHDLARHGKQQLLREVDKGFGTLILRHGSSSWAMTQAHQPDFRPRSIRSLPCEPHIPGRPNWAARLPNGYQAGCLLPEDRLPHHISIHRSNTSRFACFVARFNGEAVRETRLPIEWGQCY